MPIISTSNSGRIYVGEDYEKLLTEIDNWIIKETKKIVAEKGEIINFSYSTTHYRTEKAGAGTITGYVGSAIIMYKK